MSTSPRTKKSSWQRFTEKKAGEFTKEKYGADWQAERAKAYKKSKYYHGGHQTKSASRELKEKEKAVLEWTAPGPVSPRMKRQFNVVIKKQATSGGGIGGAAIGAGIGAVLGSKLEDAIKQKVAESQMSPRSSVMGVKRVETKTAKPAAKAPIKAPTLKAKAPLSPKTSSKSTFQRDVAARNNYIKSGTWKS
jgi:hypothetical protein